MKYIFPFLLACVSFTLKSQTYHSQYRVVSANSFIKGAITNYDISEVDTVDFSNAKGLVVIISSLDVYSNDTLSYLQFTTRKTNHSTFVPIGKTINVLIDHKNQLIYAEHSGAIKPYIFPDADSILNQITFVSFVQDSISKTSYKLDDDKLEVTWLKEIPSEVRCIFLPLDNRWGVSKLATQTQIFELIEFKQDNFDFKETVERLREICTQKMDEESLLYMK